MTVPPSFSEGIGRIASGLRENTHTHDHLNGAAARIDHLGRKLHGIGFVRDREIADCFTAAIRELDASHVLPEEERGGAAEQAAAHLEAALAHVRDGVAPEPG